MKNQKEQLKIYESINEFFSRVLELKDSELIIRYFEFLKKVPDHSPFNNTLVFIQNPDCSYYATAKQWEGRFNRIIKKDARPMVVLFPFGPVDFVYDIKDTEGETITHKKIIYWWRENGGTLNEKIIEKTFLNLKKIKIDYKQLRARKYFEKIEFRTGGYAQLTLQDSKVSIALHPRYSKASIESYGVLCHEIAHILLGHLGQIVIPSKKENKPNKEIVKDRQKIPKHTKEIEAELVAWIVFNGLGIEKNSESYIAGWLTGQKDIEKINMSDVLRVSGKIQEMGKRKNVFM